MAAGQVNRGLLESFYQNAGDVYLDTKTEGAFDVIADQVDENWNDYAPVKAALNSTASGASGAHYVKSAPMSGIVGTNLYAQLSDLLSKVLTLNNITPYTPTTDYHPTTLKYVVDSINAAIVNVGGTAIIQTGTVFPSTPTGGQSFFKTNENRFYVYSGTAWEGTATTGDLRYLTSEPVSRTITVGVGKDYTTIQAAINSVGKNILNGVNVTIQLDPGTYPEDLVIDRFYGSGNLSILGATSAATTHNVSSITITNCHISMVIGGFNLTIVNTAVLLNRALYVILQNLNIVGVATGQTGILGVSGSSFTIQNSVISNRNSAISASSNSHIFSNNTSGTGNVIALQAQQGAVIAKNGTQPTATTAESATQGGVIR